MSTAMPDRNPESSQLEAGSSKLEARSSDSDPQQIRDLVAAWARASAAGDLDAILPLMDDDILFLTHGAEPFGRDAFVQHFTANVKQMDLNVTAHVREVEVRQDLAFARTWLEVRITPPNADPVTRTGYSLAVYRRRPGGPWKLWRDANLV